jgi:hypothetical protein
MILIQRKKFKMELEPKQHAPMFLNDCEIGNAGNDISAELQLETS